MFTGSKTINCSEVLKFNLNPEIHLRLLFEFNELQKKLELISSFDCSLSRIFLTSISVYTVIQFLRTQLLLRKILCIYGLFYTMRIKFPELRVLNLFGW